MPALIHLRVLMWSESGQPTLTTAVVAKSVICYQTVLTSQRARADCLGQLLTVFLLAITEYLGFVLI